MRDDRMEELYSEHRGTRYAASTRREYVDETRYVSPQYEADQCTEPEGRVEGTVKPWEPRALTRPPDRPRPNGYPQPSHIDTHGTGQEPV